MEKKNKQILTIMTVIVIIIAFIIITSIIFNLTPPTTVDNTVG